MKLLYAEDSIELANLYIEIMESRLPNVKIHHVVNGQDAIDCLQCESFDLIISDYKMPKKNGGDLYNYLKDNNRDESFILLTGENFKELEEFRDINKEENNRRTKLLNKPCEEDVLIETIKLALSIEESSSTEQEVHENNTYIQYDIDRFLSLNKAPCEIYIKLSEKKWIKVLNEGEIEVFEVINKYKNKGIVNLCIKSNDQQSFLSSLGETLVGAMSLNDEVSSASKVSVAENVILTVQEQLQNFGFKREQVTQVKKLVTHVIDTYSENMTIQQLLSDLENSNSGYLYKHSMMTGLVANLLLKCTEWSNVEAQEKLTMASLFHDISLKNDSNFDLDKKSFLIGLDKDNQEITLDFRLHPQRSVELLSKVTEIPDIFTIILEHHEKPNGTGFPRGLKAQRISPLSCVLIVSHHFTDLLLDENFDYSHKDEILNTFEKSYQEGHFQEVMNALKKSLA
ncbi:MAG: response regulator [Bacteriovoracaceae bacterium]|nr:response regulator [Bacteriovoracaceae bacterium]